MVEKYIFLDIDGVLTKNNSGILDSKIMSKLCDLLEEEDAEVILSSSWRSYDVESTIKSLIGDRDVKNTPMRWVYRISGVTPQILTDDYDWDESREQEIMSYLKKYTGITNYVIVDDCVSESNPYNQQFLGRVVAPNTLLGLQNRDFDRIREILGSRYFIPVVGAVIMHKDWLAPSNRNKPGTPKDTMVIDIDVSSISKEIDSVIQAHVNHYIRTKIYCYSLDWLTLTTSLRGREFPITNNPIIIPNKGVL